MFKISTSMSSTIDKILHNHHLISTDCNYTIPSQPNKGSHNYLTTTLLLSKNKIIFCYFILNSTETSFTV